MILPKAGVARAPNGNSHGEAPARSGWGDDGAVRGRVGGRGLVETVELFVSLVMGCGFPVLARRC